MTPKHLAPELFTLSLLWIPTTSLGLWAHSLPEIWLWDLQATLFVIAPACLLFRLARWISTSQQ